MSRREHLSFQYYDPAFNYNLDRFCCSRANVHMLKNIACQNPPIVISKDYSANRNYTAQDLATPLWYKNVFGASGNTYTFDVQGRDYVVCSRKPQNVNFNELPCSKTRPTGRNPGCCYKSDNTTYGC